MSEQALTRIEPQGESFGAMVQRAIDKGVSVETMERILAMYEKMEARHAKAEFDRALAAFQAECPTIQKTKKVMNKDGRSVRYQYAPLEVIVQQVKALLQTHGFSYTVDAEVEPGLVRATCKATHHLGHSQTSSFSVPIDKDAYMNPAQQCASALTFAKRYAFVNAFGILTGDEDDDSISSHDDKKSQSQERPRTSGPSARTQPTPAQQPAHAGQQASATNPAKAATNQPLKQATEKTRDWFLGEMRKRFDDNVILQWACDEGPPYRLMPNESLEDWPLPHVPTSHMELDHAIARCANFMGVEPRPVPVGTPQNGAGASRPPSTTAAPPSGASEAKPEPKKANPEPDHHKADWYAYKMPFGKDKGKMLGELPKNTLYGWYANFHVETTYNGKPKKPETIANDKRLRQMLDQAGKFYKFDEPKDDPNEGDPGFEADEPPFSAFGISFET